jgi:hypothetical protein
MSDLASLLEMVAVDDLAERRHMCALNGPCSDNGDGCSCPDIALFLPIKAGEAVPVAWQHRIALFDRAINAQEPTQ